MGWFTLRNFCCLMLIALVKIQLNSKSLIITVVWRHTSFTLYDAHCIPIKSWKDGRWTAESLADTSSGTTDSSIASSIALK